MENLVTYDTFLAKNQYFGAKSKFWPKIKMLVQKSKIHFLVKNPKFWSKIKMLLKNPKFWSTIHFLLKNQIFYQKSKILINNPFFAQKSNFLSKIKMLLKNPKFWSKINFLVKNQIFYLKSKCCSKINILVQKIHLFSCHPNESIVRRWSGFDQFGLWTAIIGCYIPGLRLGLWCVPEVNWLYSCTVILTGISGMILLRDSKFIKKIRKFPKNTWIKM